MGATTEKGNHEREGDGSGPSWLEILTQGVLPCPFQVPVPSLSLPRWSLHIPVVLFLHQVVAGAESHQVCVIGRGWNGHRARAAHVGVAQLVGQDLQLISCEAVVVPQHVVV